jgi:hypothetical protein
MLLALVSIAMLIGLLAAINHFGTPRYRLGFYSGQLEALCIFASETSYDMFELCRLHGGVAFMDQFFTQRLIFITNRQRRS